MSERERPASLLDAALAMGALVTIATGGALIGLGLQSGEPSRVFRLVGRALLERAGVTSTGAPLTSVALGYLHHLVVATVWGAIIGLIVLPLRGINRVLAAIGITLLYMIVASRWLPPAMRIGFAVTANVPGAVPIAVALLVAVLGGVWLAATETTA
ncbi:MAG: hypothetical protein V4617_20410 [Gemmatimonadota bacterium]